MSRNCLHASLKCATSSTDQWRAVHGSKGSIASVVKKRKEFIHK
jgi:hypothetical protein